MLTVIASIVFINPGEGQFGSNDGHQADVHLVRVEGGLLGVLVPGGQDQTVFH